MVTGRIGRTHRVHYARMEKINAAFKHGATDSRPSHQPRDERMRVDRETTEKIIQLYWYERLSLREIGRRLKTVSHTTIWRVVSDQPTPVAIREKLEKYLKQELPAINERSQRPVAQDAILVVPRKLKKSA